MSIDFDVYTSRQADACRYVRYDVSARTEATTMQTSWSPGTLCSADHEFTVVATICRQEPPMGVAVANQSLAAFEGA